MTGETAAELRARLGALAEKATPGEWGICWSDDDGFDSCWIEGPELVDPEGQHWGGPRIPASDADAGLILALVNAWPAIDGMLARLAAAEADAETPGPDGMWTCHCCGMRYRPFPPVWRVS